MKKICFVTGSRAEYGLLSELIRIVDNANNYKYQLIVTGSHLLKKYGLTEKQIKLDGFKINKKINIIEGDKDDSSAIIKSTAAALKKVSLELNKLNPDLVIVLGDRYEILATSIAANFLRIPICHFHGGEITEGLIDEAIRHSVTKMSSLHFVANEIYRKRVIQLGENPRKVFNVGGMGIDTILKTKLLSKSNLEKKLAIQFKPKIILITYHPVTLEKNTSKTQFKNIIKALKFYSETSFIFTLPNADMDGNIIIKLIKEVVKKNDNYFYFKSLGQQKYYSLLRYSSIILGNSSSGIIEAPFFKKPTVNIGERQKGRLKADTIIDCKPKVIDIKRAIDLAFNKKFTNKCKTSKSLYGNGGSSIKSFNIIKKEINKIKIKKTFYDINYKL